MINSIEDTRLANEPIEPTPVPMSKEAWNALPEIEKEKIKKADIERDARNNARFAAREKIKSVKPILQTNAMVTPVTPSKELSEEEMLLQKRIEKIKVDFELKRLREKSKELKPGGAGGRPKVRLNFASLAKAAAYIESQPLTAQFSDEAKEAMAEHALETSGTYKKVEELLVGFFKSRIAPAAEIETEGEAEAELETETEVGESETEGESEAEEVQTNFEPPSDV